MGSKLCSRFRKFKRKVLGKKPEKYDRLEEPAKEELPPDKIVVVPVDVRTEKPVDKQHEESNEREKKEDIVDAENTQDATANDDIENYIFTLEEELKISGKKQEEKEELYSNLGAAYYRICDFTMSKKYYEMYYKIIKKSGSSELLQRARCNLGCVYRRLGEFEQAEEHFKAGLEISEEIQDKKSKGRLLNNLGNICEMKKDFEGAIYYHAQRRKVAETLGDWESEAKACASLGNAYHIVGNLRASIVFYERVVIWLKRKYRKYYWSIGV